MHHTILTCYYRPKPGGCCKRLFRAMEALLARGHVIHYLAVLPFPIEHPNCRFHRFPWPENKTSGYLFWGFFHLVAPFQLLFIGIRCKVERLFTFSGHSYALMLQPLRIFGRMPLTVFFRGDAIRYHTLAGRSNWLVELELFLEGLAISKTRFYGVSATLSDAIIQRHRWFQPVSHDTLPNDIKEPETSASGMREKKTSSPMRLGCVGMIEKGKNPQLLIEMMQKIPSDKAQLCFYGTGPAEEELLESINRAGLKDSVFLMGWTEAEQIWPQVDLLLMPSFHEGAPNAVLEAIGHGIPVLASDIPEHGEILPTSPLLPTDDPDAWSRAVITTMDNPEKCLLEMQELQRKGAERLFFDWDAEISRLICA